MSEALLDRLLWLPLESVDEKHIIDSMTIMARKMEGAVDVKLYEYDRVSNMIGVPRRWGLKALKEYWGVLGLKDRTTFPHVEWPEFRWPIVNGVKWDYRPGQRRTIDQLLNAFKSGKYGALLDASCGCHRIGQKLLMYDGSVKKVEDILENDLLMGPDSKPRKVNKLVRGVGQMYRIRPLKGDSFVVNEDHLLTLTQYGNGKVGHRGKIFDISVKDYLRLPNKQFYKLFRVSIGFALGSKKVPIDPYFLGILIGDGSLKHQLCVTTGDVEIEKVVRENASKYMLGIRETVGRGCKQLFLMGLDYYERRHGLMSDLDDLKLLGTSAEDKFIPNVYKVASVEIRRHILAGLVDTDGSLATGCIDYISKSKKLALDVCFIARSLGLAAYWTPCVKKCQNGGCGNYYRVSISGDISILPSKLSRKQARARKIDKNVLNVGFTIEELGVEPYYGFTLNDDGRYLLEDFTVTHNSGKSLIGMKVAEELQTNALILVHKQLLADQFRQQAATGYADDNRNWVTPFWPGIKFGHVQQNELNYKGCHLVTAMAQTLWARKDRIPEDFWKHFGLIITDEGHIYPAETFEGVKRMFWARYRLDMSATWRRTDGMECVWHHHVGLVEAKLRPVRLTGEFVQPRWRTNLTDEFVGGGPYASAKWSTAIAENNAFNHWIADQMVESFNTDRQMLVVSHRREQCFQLRKMFMDKMVKLKKVPNVGVLVGNTAEYKLDADEKKRVLRKKIIVATYGMFEMALDVPRLDTLLFATPKQDIEQIVGRIQRDADKNPLLIIDPVFQTPHNMKMARKRLEWYDKLGFKPQNIANVCTTS